VRTYVILLVVVLRKDNAHAPTLCFVCLAVPRQMLLGFTRITTAPGGTTTATVEVAADRLRLVGADGQFGLLHGDYELHVGGRAPGYTPDAAQIGAPLTRTLRVV
jgi:hypothetical protein